ncbi:MAG: tetratricopeptide repeat protein [Candidatus Thiosymbion ectosymbiont of Robbea hypermnestra]|nr:tetratricopeptide repeat protein [Candidatus Thiosymbion ectosymbiont of Robbea hypermnestra]
MSVPGTGKWGQVLIRAFKSHGSRPDPVPNTRPDPVPNNLGEAWRVLGEYDKAIGYLEQALASDLETYGADHPAVARDRNNLGLAWDALGDYHKAIGYYEQALAICERKLGSEHPYTRITRKNLAAARAAQKP